MNNRRSENLLKELEIQNEKIAELKDKVVFLENLCEEKQGKLQIAIKAFKNYKGGINKMEDIIIRIKARRESALEDSAANLARLLDDVIDIIPWNHEPPHDWFVKSCPVECIHCGEQIAIKWEKIK